MLTAIKGYYENGQITLSEMPPVFEKTEVVVTFLNKEAVQPQIDRKSEPLKGKISVPDDFDEPLEDFKDYM